MGSSLAPASCAARMNGGPAMTSASLFARSTRLPAAAAASVAGRPAAPTIAAMTAWQSSCVTTAPSAPAPNRSSVPVSENLLCKSRSSPTPDSTAYRGRWLRHSASSGSAAACAVSARTWYRSGWRATTSSVLAPMEPVAPRTVRFTGSMTGHQGQERRRERQGGSCAVNTVQNAPMSGQGFSAVLYSCLPLCRRLEQVADDARGAQQRGAGEVSGPLRAGKAGTPLRHECCADDSVAQGPEQPAGSALPCL